MINQKQAGFTAVELLITLFVAAAFLIAGYQLFSVVIRDGGQTRAESRAANIAYDYLRKYSGVVSNPCTAETLVDNEEINVSGLTDVTVNVSATCLLSDLSTVSKIEATITYNDPQRTVSYVTYVDTSRGSESVTTEITDGLVAWWKFNGNANSSLGSSNGAVYGATLTTSQNGSPNGAYNFNGTNQYIEFTGGEDLFGSQVMSNVTVSFWARPTVLKNTSIVVAQPDVTTNRLNVHLGWSDGLIYWDFGNYSSGGRVTATFNSAWLNTWSYYTFTAQSGVGMKIYRNGTQIGSSGTTSTFTVESKSLRVARYDGGSSYWPGMIDDLRIYNRALSTSEIQALYSRGAQ